MHGFVTTSALCKPAPHASGPDAAQHSPLALCALPSALLSAHFPRSKCPHLTLRTVHATPPQVTNTRTRSPRTPSAPATARWQSSPQACPLQGPACWQGLRRHAHLHGICTHTHTREYVCAGMYMLCVCMRERLQPLHACTCAPSVCLHKHACTLTYERLRSQSLLYPYQDKKSCAYKA